VLYDGDLVRVLPVLDEVRNVVYVEGNVYRPGTYEFTQGLTVGDLVMKAEGPLPEAHLPRVDLFRLNDDGRTTTLIPINLELALRGDEAHNVRLQQRDRLAVYSRWEVQWLAERVVSAQGAVPNPGSFERADEMRVSDLLLQAGGVLPEAHLQKAILFRLNANGQVAEGIEVNLEEALQKDPAADLLLQDGDALLVYRFDEVRWMPEREVAVSGAVQKPGTYPRLDNMRVSDLLFQSGGLLPEAATTGLLLRRNENWEVAESFIIDFTMAHKKQPEADLLLKDGDSLIAYTQDEKQWRPPREVSITGAVQTPGVYQRTDGMRVSDLLFQAGGVLPNAYLERANLQRYLADQESLETIPVNLVKATAGDAEADLMLRNRDALVVSTIREAAYQPNRVVTIFGAVQRPDTYMRTANMRVSDLLFVAGGVLPGARETIEVARARGDGQTTIITVSLMEIYKGNPTQDILLDDLDIVAVPRRQDFREVPLTVEINGLVKYPGAYAIEKDDRLSDLIARAGGLMPHAFPEGAIFTRKREKLIERAQEEALRRTWEEIEKEKQNEYLRRLARSRLSLQQPGVVEQLSSTVTSVVETAAEAPLAIVGALGEAGETTQANEAGGLEQQPEMLSAIDETAPQPQVIQSPTGTEINLVTPARKIEDLVPNQRIFVDLPAILKEPGGKEDILLEEGDAIDIPRVRETVLVSGAVIYAGPFLYQQGKTVQEYIDMAGGYARDADRKGVYVLKANGIAHQLNKVKHVDRGDIIVVPTQVMVEKVTNRWSQVVGIVRLVIVATTTIILIDRLTN
jgi:protein involved in polysaccharide export with SLBB domain